MTNRSKTAALQHGIRIVPQGADLPKNTELWRYMSLSALLMLLRGRVYIPTICNLRSGDPLEARSLCAETRKFLDNPTGMDRKWLLSWATKIERGIFRNPKAAAAQRAKIFARIWDLQLAKRRRIWCWHESKIESMALWHVYAAKGIAIKTTPAQIVKAFNKHLVPAALIGRVHYTDNAGAEGLPHHFMRPYLIKRRCYKYEQEVRVVIPRDSDNPDDRSLLPINPRALIAEIRISPHIPRSEAAELRRSIIEAWRNKKKFFEKEKDLPVFVSETKAEFDSEIDYISHNDVEATGIANFGTTNMPFVMRGDFSEMPSDK